MREAGGDEGCQEKLGITGEMRDDGKSEGFWER